MATSVTLTAADAWAPKTSAGPCGCCTVCLSCATCCFSTKSVIAVSGLPSVSYIGSEPPVSDQEKISKGFAIAYNAVVVGGIINVPFWTTDSGYLIWRFLGDWFYADGLGPFRLKIEISASCITGGTPPPWGIAVVTGVDGGSTSPGFSPTNWSYSRTPGDCCGVAATNADWPDLTTPYSLSVEASTTISLTVTNNHCCKNASGQCEKRDGDCTGECNPLP